MLCIPTSTWQNAPKILSVFMLLVRLSVNEATGECRMIYNMRANNALKTIASNCLERRNNIVVKIISNTNLKMK